jgi:nicotinamidase-related amidase
MNRVLEVAAAFSVLMVCGTTSRIVAQDLSLSLRSQMQDPTGTFDRKSQDAVWPASSTAIIVCDVWDKHHCLNAVRRMEEFLPRLDAVLTEARRRGVTIIHAPSDCMPAYDNHPARLRALTAPRAGNLPADARFWCSQIPAEKSAAYPIDQSDGGEDDDPVEHAQWAAELKALGRNPAMPWKTQHPGVTIDAERDYISDRGDEVWNVLEARGLRHVILVGVHTNMCVLGRPFGLRQLARHGREVVLMRDLTDSMYNPKRWPYVDHFTGHDLVVSHVERYVCPTITSDQIVGGRPFASAFDRRETREVMSLADVSDDDPKPHDHWQTIRLPLDGSAPAAETNGSEVTWLRCTVRLPSEWTSDTPMSLLMPAGDFPAEGEVNVWLNGTPLVEAGTVESEFAQLALPATAWLPDDINLLVLRQPSGFGALTDRVPVVSCGKGRDLELNGTWQFRHGDIASWSNIPLPAKFGMGSDVLFQPRE